MLLKKVSGLLVGIRCGEDGGGRGGEGGGEGRREGGREGGWGREGTKTVQCDCPKGALSVAQSESL